MFDEKSRVNRTLIDAHAERVALALAAADKAVSKETAAEKRFESVDEFRQTLCDQTRSLVSKVEFDAVRDSSAVRIADLASRLDKTEGKAVGLNAGWVYLDWRAVGRGYAGEPCRSRRPVDELTGG